MKNSNFIFLLFIIYSFIGWCLEVILVLLTKKKFINRGFLIGPYCPIYGIGSLLVIYLLNNYLYEPITLFILSIVICSVIEYSVSLILEKLFKTSWWDYTNKKFNINGRICLETMIPFGIGCMCIMYIVNPFITNIIGSIPTNILDIIAIVIFIIFLTDIIISLKIIINFRDISNNAKVDSTEKVTKYVKKILLEKRNALYTRFINAFPNMKIIKIKRK